MVKDQQKIYKLWSHFYKAWFDDENDVRIVLIKIEIEAAEYWDHPGGKVGAYIEMVSSAITGIDKNHDEHEQMTL